MYVLSDVLTEFTLQTIVRTKQITEFYCSINSFALVAMAQEKSKDSSYAKASDPADKQRKANESVERAPPVAIHIECSVSCNPSYRL